MSAPGQQPNDPAQQTGGNGVAPGAGSPGPVVSGQPQYGQYAQPDYGAMLSQFGPDYNPYLYGAPDPEPQKDDAGETAQAARQRMPQRTPGAAYPGGYGQNGPYGGAQGPQGPYGQQGPNGPYPQNGPYAPNGNPNGNPTVPGNGANDGHTPRYFYGIDVNDPNQNPLYGRWDSYAIIAFVFALVFSVPLLPTVMGVISVWRTGTFHMKGRGLAIAAIVINLITTAVQIWMWVNGIDVTDLTNQMLNMVGGGSGSGDTMTT
ncbi:hypothetical protein [Bifidobacterium parmae]|uniref:DUF4190 domain-containing protein n=1 Tax=Bifidobacterium parmae TaxID=361854 RepID=A0A2N5J5Q7_9BIFI|nr:hypothetical protein [Bifidobacterium parmae]PLS29545.1 hypothetical protein Uis4E_0419 [Bifidobacterium parmae]